MTDQDPPSDERPEDPPLPEDLPGDRRTDGPGDGGFFGSAEALGDLLDEDGTDVLPADLAREVRDDVHQRNIESMSEEIEAERPVPPEPPESVIPELSGGGMFGSSSREAKDVPDVTQVATRDGFGPPGCTPAVMMVAAGLIAVIAIALVALGGGSGDDPIAVDDGGEVVDDAPGGSDESDESDDSGDSAGSAPETTAAVTTAPPPTECESARSAPSTLSFSSVELADGISEKYLQRNAYENGFATPSFEWTGVPAETTELVITIHMDRTADGVDLSAPDLWDGTDTSKLSAFWIASGIDPATSALPDSAFGVGLPAGVIEQDHGSVTVTVDGEPLANKFFVAGSSDEPLVFSIFALCDPVASPDMWRPNWLSANAIDKAWFLAAAGGP